MGLPHGHGKTTDAARPPLQDVVAGLTTRGTVAHFALGGPINRAAQRRAMMSLYCPKIRFESQLSRMNCQRFSTGVSSGDLGGRGTSEMFSGTSSFGDGCHPT